MALVARSTSLAATIAVTSTADDLDLGPNGDCTLREAILAANGDVAVDGCAAGSGADTIVLPAGRYTLTIPRPADDSDSPLVGDLDIAGDLTVEGAGADATILDANHISRALDIADGGHTVTLRDVTITNGNAELDLGRPTIPGSGRGERRRIARHRAFGIRWRHRSRRPATALAASVAHWRASAGPSRCMTPSSINTAGYPGGGAVWLSNTTATFVDSSFLANHQFGAIAGFLGSLFYLGRAEISRSNEGVISIMGYVRRNNSRPARRAQSPAAVRTGPGTAGLAARGIIVHQQSARTRVAAPSWRSAISTCGKASSRETRALVAGMPGADPHNRHDRGVRDPTRSDRSRSTTTVRPFGAGDTRRARLDGDLTLTDSVVSENAGDEAGGFSHGPGDFRDANPDANDDRRKPGDPLRGHRVVPSVPRKRDPGNGELIDRRERVSRARERAVFRR
ncbi:MAG: CSLREA domain-containing protein [bacterium]